MYVRLFYQKLANSATTKRNYQMANDRLSTTEITFKDIVKQPIVYMLLVAVSAAWFFVYQYTGASGQVNKNCEAEKVILRVDNNKKDEKIDQLINTILFLKGVNIQQKIKTDSLIRDKVGNEAKQIIK